MSRRVRGVWTESAVRFVAVALSSVGPATAVEAVVVAATVSPATGEPTAGAGVVVVGGGEVRGVQSAPAAASTAIDDGIPSCPPSCPSSPPSSRECIPSQCVVAVLEGAYK